jgi:hypothetical protein
MSFYGGIFNQISNAFERVGIKNSGKNTISFLNNDPTDLEIKADGREGFIEIDSGNRWIELKGDVVDNSCKIYHGQADGNNTTTHLVMEKVNELPSEVIPIDVKLDTNVYIKINNVKYDEAGHISSTIPSYLKFHVVEAEAKITDMQNDISDFKEIVENRMTTAETTVGGYNNRLTTVEGFETSIEKNKNDIKGINDLIGNKSELGVSETLCEILGNISNLRKADKDFSNLSLSEIIGKLDDKDGIMELTMAGLINRIEALEEKI